MVDILLATYNGGKFLREQVESILRQGCGDWRLLVGDDGSTDGTVQTLQAYASQSPERILLRTESRQGVGTCGNFASLLETSTADYVMFCDQDDIWMPNKIELFMEEMARLERAHGKKTPLLIHSDLKVLRNGRIYESFWSYQRLNPRQGDTLNRLLVQNTVTGCATMINAPLRDLCRTIPTDAIMHDWWAALAAAAFGKISRMAVPTVIYRQHDSNAIGAKKWGVDLIRSRLKQPGQIRLSLHKTRRQAAAFLECYRHRLPEPQYQLVQCYADLDQRTFWGKRGTIVRHGFFKCGLIRTIGMLVFV